MILQVADLVTSELGVTLLLMPHLDGPIVGAGEEDWAFVRVPEGVASHAVDRTHMAVVVHRVTLRERG